MPVPYRASFQMDLDLKAALDASGSDHGRRLSPEMVFRLRSSLIADGYLDADGKLPLPNKKAATKPKKK